MVRSASFAALALAFVLVAPASARVPGVAFVHVSTVDNILTNTTFLDHPLLNGHPGATFFVTQNWNPGGGGGLYNDREVGLFYSQGTNRWGIYNEDDTDMLARRSFNVFIPAQELSPSVHLTFPFNVTSNWTSINRPSANDDPNAIVFVNHRYNGAFHPHSLGVFYTSGTGRWAIFNQQALVDMPIDLRFNVLVAPDDPDVFVHTASALDVAANSTFLDHPRLNGNPDAIVFVTQNWNPGGGLLGVYNDHAIGVWYHEDREQWGIFNQDLAVMPLGASFNVLVPEPEGAPAQAVALGALARRRHRRAMPSGRIGRFETS